MSRRPLLKYGVDGPTFRTNKPRPAYRSSSPESKKIRQRPPPDTKADVRFHKRSFVAKRGYALPLRCYLHGETLNVLWTALRDAREKFMCLNKEDQYRRTCRMLTTVENRLHDLADLKSRRPYWPTFALLVREMRKLYYEKVDLLLTIVRDTDMNPAVKASDIQRAMAPALLPNNIDVEIFATVLTEANVKREIDCAIRQIRKANLFQERETLDRLQWSGSARAYLRAVADHAAKKLLIEAQISRGESKRIHPIHMLLRSDVASRSVLAEQPVPFDREYTHLQNCGDLSRGSQITKRRRDDVSRTFLPADYGKYNVPYGLGELGKLATLVGSVDLHQAKRVLALLNQYVHGVLRDIVYRCIVLIAGRKKRTNVTGRVGLSDVVYATKDVLGVKLLTDDDANDLTKIGRVNAVDALEQSARYLTNAHDSVNSLFESMFGHEVARRRDVATRTVDVVRSNVSRPKARPMADFGRGQGGKLLATMKRNEAQALPRKRTRSLSASSTSRTSKRRANKSRRTSTVEETIAPLAYTASVSASSNPRITPIVVEESERRATPPPYDEDSSTAAASSAPTAATPTDPRIVDGEFIG